MFKFKKIIEKININFKKIIKSKEENKECENNEIKNKIIKEKNSNKKEMISIIKVMILIILILLTLITSFRSGEKFYILKNTNHNSKESGISASVMRWNFKVKIIYDDKEVELNEKN